VNRTTLVVGAGIILCATSLFWLQGRFDKSDHEKSRRLVMNLTRPTGGETFGQFLTRRHGGRQGEWRSEITGGCRGVVRVSWVLAGSPPLVYTWDVEIPSQAVHPNPASPAGERMLLDFVSQREERPLELPPLPETGQPSAPSN
jgi:hypothetical protein